MTVPYEFPNDFGVEPNRMAISATPIRVVPGKNVVPL